MKICRILSVRHFSLIFTCQRAKLNKFEEKLISQSFFLLEGSIVQILRRIVQVEPKIIKKDIPIDLSSQNDVCPEEIKLEEINKELHKQKTILQQIQDEEERAEVQADMDVDHVPTISEFVDLMTDYQKNCEKYLEKQNEILDEIEDRIYLFTLHNETGSLKNGNINEIKEMLVKELKIPLESILGIEAKAGSIVYKVLVDPNLSLEAFTVIRNSNFDEKNRRRIVEVKGFRI